MLAAVHMVQDNIQPVTMTFRPSSLVTGSTRAVIRRLEVMVASQGVANPLESEGGASHLGNHGLHTLLIHQLGLVPLPAIGEEGQPQP